MQPVFVERQVRSQLKNGMLTLEGVLLTSVTGLTMPITFLVPYFRKFLLLKNAIPILLI
jgi:hypothetical protein